MTMDKDNLNQIDKDDLTTTLGFLEQVAPSAAGAQAIKVRDKVRGLTKHINWANLQDWRAGASAATILSTLPLDVLEAQDFQEIHNWLSQVEHATWIGIPLANKLLPRLIESKRAEDALTVFAALTQKTNLDDYGDEANAVIDKHFLSSMVQASSSELGELCGMPAVKLMATRFEQYIGTVDNDTLSFIWRSAIEEHDQNIRDEDARCAIVDGLRDTSLGATRRSRQDAHEVVTFLLSSKYPTIVRIGIHTCTERYELAREVFWKFASADWFESHDYWHEIYWFIKSNYAHFTASERETFLRLIKLDVGNISPTDGDIAALRNQRDILHAIYGQNDPELDEAYRKLLTLSGPVREHPDFHNYTGPVRWVGDKSPVTADEIARMSDNEFLNFCNNFQPSPNRLDDEFTYTGVANEIALAVRKSANTFTGRFHLFSELDWTFKHGLLKGLEERWKEDQKDIDWQELRTFISSFVLSPEFVIELNTKQPETWKPTIFWVISDIANLLQASSIKERQLDTANLIGNLRLTISLLHLIQRTPAKLEKDPVFHVINSPRGRCIEAFLNLSLALKRAEQNKNGDSFENWDEIRTILEEELTFSVTADNLEFSVLGGIYCSNLHYINAQWTEDNFHRLFPINNHIAWWCAIHGFSYQSYVYDWLYARLLHDGHLEQIIFNDSLPDSVVNRALEFVALAYLNNYLEHDTSSLLHRIIKNLKEEHISHLAWFFWTMRDKDKPSPHSAKILRFLSLALEQLQASSEPHIATKASLSKLIAFADELNEELETIFTYLVPFSPSWNGQVLLENFARLAVTSPVPVSRLLLVAAETDALIPDLFSEDLIKVVRTISAVGERQTALEICNAYAIKGSTILKPIYIELRANPSQLQMLDSD